MSIDQKKENQKKRLAKQLRTNLMRRKAQAKQRIIDGEDADTISDTKPEGYNARADISDSARD